MRRDCFLGSRDPEAVDLFLSPTKQFRGSFTGSATFELGVLNWGEQEGESVLWGFVLLIEDKEAGETERHRLRWGLGGGSRQLAYLCPLHPHLSDL